MVFLILVLEKVYFEKKISVDDTKSLVGIDSGLGKAQRARKVSDQISLEPVCVAT